MYVFMCLPQSIDNYSCENQLYSFSVSLHVTCHNNMALVTKYIVKAAKEYIVTLL